MLRCFSPAGMMLVVALFSSVASSAEPEAKPLFNGKDTQGWKNSSFGGDGEVKVEEGNLILSMGDDLTGVTFTGKVPTMNYELLVEAQRLEGLDFFAAVTFPIGKGHASFIPGGWSGGVTGISCINGFDASENETTKYKTYKDKQWYQFRIRVTEPRLQVWVDKELTIDLDTKDKTFDTRGEVEGSKPLGIATWRTTSAIRAIKIRDLTPEEIRAAASSDKSATEKK